MDYEAQRLENVAQKERLLNDLNLNNSRYGRKAEKEHSETPQPTKKRKLVHQRTMPSRTSARIASSESKVSYNEDVGEKYDSTTSKSKVKNTKGLRRATNKNATREDLQEGSKTRISSKDADDICAGWTRWEPTEPTPTRDEDGSFYFEDFPLFYPNKSPEEIIREGSFGGSYWRPLISKTLGIMVEGDWQELPQEWLQRVDVGRYLVNPRYDATANKFGVKCGQSIEEWEASGWIAHEYDVRGWFQWYCRFFMGRRCRDDERQISRWNKCVGDSGRWRRALLKKYVQMGVREVFDDGAEEDVVEVSPVMHQTCHHWAFEVRQDVLDEYWRRGR